MRMSVAVPDLKEVLEHYGIDTGGRYDGEVMILCPNHSEDRPSCSANLTKNVIHCHACGFKGGVIQLIMMKEGLDDFASAVEYTAKTFGEGYGFVPESNGRTRKSLSGKSGFKPKYRNSALRNRPLSTPGA